MRAARSAAKLSGHARKDGRKREDEYRRGEDRSLPTDPIARPADQDSEDRPCKGEPAREDSDLGFAEMELPRDKGREYW